MRSKMLAILFLAMLMNRCVHVAHAPIVARFYPHISLSPPVISVASHREWAGVR